MFFDVDSKCLGSKKQRMQLGPTAIYNSATRPIEICCLPLDEVYDVLKCVEKYLRCTNREGIMSRKKHQH